MTAQTSLSQAPLASSGWARVVEMSRQLVRQSLRYIKGDAVGRVGGKNYRSTVYEFSRSKDSGNVSEQVSEEYAWLWNSTWCGNLSYLAVALDET